MALLRDHLEIRKRSVHQSKSSADILNLIHYTNCPSCSHANIRKITQAKDHTVTGEIFEIWECGNCFLRFTQNVPDESSIGRYYKSENYISHSNTSTGFVNTLYHAVRKITIRSKRRMVEKYSGTSSGSLLDVGAGTGVFSASMKAAGWNVTALEPDPAARDIALKEYGITLSKADDLFKMPDALFDTITLWHVLEHIHQLHDYLRQLKKLLRSDGCIIIAVPNYISLDAKMYKSNWAAYDVPRHLYHFCPTAMKELLRKHGLTISKILPMWFDSFYVSLLSEKYQTGRSNFLKGAVKGFMSNVKAAGNKETCSSLIYVVRPQ